jgi:membrane protease subunit HflC
MKMAEKKEKKPAGEKNVIGTVVKYITAALVVLVLFWFGFVCQVREGDCAVILRFGAVRKEATQAGVYLKLPWPFETVVTYDARYQYLESNQLETTTRDKRNIILQSYVVWRVEDPVLFHNSVGARGMTESYIKDQVFSATNSTLGAYELSQLVSLETEKIKLDEIQAQICQRVQQTCRENYGIQVSDVNILRLTLPNMNLQSVFAQMTADRQKDINAIIADAQVKATEITSGAAQEAAQIIAEGTTEAARIKAETETEVARIYAEAQAANLELYQFLMNLDTMVASVDENTVLIVKADEYPFNILTEYSKHMTVEGNATVVNDLSYILGQLNAKDRKALIDAVSQLIKNAEKKAG